MIFPSTPFIIDFNRNTISYKQVKMLVKNAKEPPPLPTFKRHFDSNSDFFTFFGIAESLLINVAKLIQLLDCKRPEDTCTSFFFHF